MSEEFNPYLQQVIFEVVENQIEDNDPPEITAAQRNRAMCQWRLFTER